MIIARLHGIKLEEVAIAADGPRGYTGGGNPLGKIPALETEAMGLIFDSPVVCEYLDSLSETPLIPNDGAARLNELRLHALGDGLSDAVYNYRYETVREESLHWEPQILRHTTALKMGVAYLNDNIKTLGGPWGFGNLAIICALDYMSYRAPHIDWQNVAPKLVEWHSRFITDSIYVDTYAY